MPSPLTPAEFDKGPAAPTSPIPLAGGTAAATARTRLAPVEVPEATMERLRATGATVTTDAVDRVEASRDWWPLAMTWAVEGQVGALAGAVVRPSDPEQVAEVLAVCDEAHLPVTAAAGRSGVLGGSVPIFGGVVLDLCGLVGIRSVDDTSLVADVLAGTFGDRFESELRTRHGLTCGHWPQSMTLSTVGGWLACRGAGQFSTRYGKIEDMVVGLDVALADGRTISTGGAPRQAAGPDLTQLFVGSEGTLGVITGARLRLHPAPTYFGRSAWAFPSFAEGLDFCRRILRRGATPAVLRLYDGIESERSYHVGVDHNVVLVLDEGDPAIVDAVMAVVADEARTADGAPATPMDDALVDTWLRKRNDVSQLEPLIQGGLVVDTMEVSGPWSALASIYDAVVQGMLAVPGVLAASAHCSHSYLDGGCLYFTFGGKPTEDTAASKASLHAAAWDAGQRAVLERGGSVSHHHGVGLHRGRYLAEALGGAHEVLQAVKDSLDPHGVLNPGKLGLRSPFGAPDLP
jgi:alkyldihydroxyacetonephosphate synthase